MRLCDWTNLTLECEHLLSSVNNLKANTSPFSLLAISTSPEDQLKCAKLWVNKQYPRSGKPFWDGKIHKHKRIRVAYVSADFHQHATAYLMAGVFELHDRSRFELTAISIGPPDTSEMRQRLKASFDHFMDARLFSDDEIASLIRDAEIDILVDLKGFTLGARTGVFARRPAPILVNYLGFPFWDVLTFPMTSAREIGELNEILVDRISPQDARTLKGFEGIGSLKGIASLYFNMKKLDQAKEYHKKVTELDPNDPEAYYSIGVIDWTEAYQPRMEERAKLGMKPDEQLKDKKVCATLSAKSSDAIKDGIDNLNKALQLRPDYDDAMAYMNLMYREKADLECTDPAGRAADLKTADEWVDKTLATKKEKAAKQPGAQGVTLDQPSK